MMPAFSLMREGNLQMRKPFCWVLIPGQSDIERIKCFWAVVGLLASEGKDTMCKMPTQDVLDGLSLDDACDEIVIVKTENWDIDSDVVYAKKWAHARDVAVRTLSTSLFC